MGRRCETPLSSPFFHRFPLIVNIERKRFGNTLAAHQFRLAGDDKTESRYTLNTLLALLIRKSIPSSSTSKGTPPKLLIASTISFFPCIFTMWAISFNGFSTPVVVSQCTTDTCVNLRIMCQIIVYIADGHLLRFVKGQHIIVDTVILSDISHTVTISSIAQNQQLSPGLTVLPITASTQ